LPSAATAAGLGQGITRTWSEDTSGCATRRVGCGPNQPISSFGGSADATSPTFNCV
jgi:hypothetical protein